MPKGKGFPISLVFTDLVDPSAILQTTEWQVTIVVFDLDTLKSVTNSGQPFATIDKRSTPDFEES